MSTVSRNLKVGGTNKFETDYQLGFDEIRASEVDADFDTIYNAWNTQIPNAVLGAGIPPAGAAGGDLTGVYPTPAIAAGVVNRAKTAADLWLVPIPTGPDVGKALVVGAGPTLTWAAAPPPVGAAGGSLTGNYPDPAIAPSGVVAGNYGSSTSIPAFNVRADGRLASVSPVTVSIPPGTTIAATPPVAPVQGQLWWRNDPDGTLYISYNDGNSTQWVPAVPAASTVAPSGPAGGDLAGTYPNPTLRTIGARAVLTAGVVVATATVTSVLWDAAPINLGTCWSIGNRGQVLLPVPGVYLVHAYTEWQGSPTGTRIMSVYNKAAVQLSRREGASSTAIVGLNAQFLYSATDPTDYLYVSVSQNSGAGLTLGWADLPFLEVWRLAT